jgi:hypothetical protein
VEEVSLGGGVWMIGMVEAGFEKAGNTVKGRMVKQPPGLEVKNRYQDLEE